MDFDSYARAGVSLGSGALLICNEDTCVVDLARVSLNFFKRESCGKCTPCRVGTRRAYQILTEISEGAATRQDLDNLQMLPMDAFSLGMLDSAMDELMKLKPLAKPRLLKACVAIILADGDPTTGGNELVRTLSTCLNCPMPPLQAPAEIAA